MHNGGSVAGRNRRQTTETEHGKRKKGLQTELERRKKMSAFFILFRQIGKKEWI
jgi:hypothetical protein